MQNRDSFLAKYFAEPEREYISKKNNAAQTIAGLYAAKEAVLKAFGAGIGGGINLNQVEIFHNINGEPYLNKNSTIVDALKKLGYANASISISHDGEYAVAFCIIF